MSEKNVTKVKVITGFKKQDFETEVNEFLVANKIESVKYDSVVKEYNTNEMVCYIAYVTYQESEGKVA